MQTQLRTVSSKQRGAVIYTRVSTGEQAEHGTSLESQRDTCCQKALSLGLPVIAQYEDAGVSGGFLLTRQGMMSAIADIQAGRADTLICSNLSRFSRDVEHQQTLLKSVKAAGGKLIFCDITFDDTPEGSLAFNIMGGFAEYEKNVIKMRTHGGRVQKANQGLQPGRAHSPMGYHIVKNADALRGEYPAEMVGKYIIKDDEAQIVREIFTRYADGSDSLSTLARWLNTSGIPTRQGGEYWRVTAVRRILLNQVYKGIGVYGKNDCCHDENRLRRTDPFTGLTLKSTAVVRTADPATWITFEVPALISEEIWNRVQQRFPNNRNGRSGNPRTSRMLAGRIFCPICGGRLSISYGRTSDVIYYTCGRNQRMQHHLSEHLHPAICYPIGIIEGAVISAITDAVQRPEVIDEVLQAYKDAEKTFDCTTSEEEMAAIEAMEHKLNSKEKAAVEAQIAGIMAGASPDAYADIFKKISVDRSALEDKRTKLLHQGKVNKDGGHKADQITIQRITAEIISVLNSSSISNHEKRGILSTIIEAVYPSKEGAKIVFQSGVLSETTVPHFVKR